MLPDLARFGGQFPRSGSFSRCRDLVSRSGQIWPDLGIWENLFFKKKKKFSQIWPDLGGPDLEIWPDLAASVSDKVYVENLVVHEK